MIGYIYLKGIKLYILTKISNLGLALVICVVPILFSISLTASSVVSTNPPAGLLSIYVATVAGCHDITSIFSGCSKCIDYAKQSAKLFDALYVAAPPYGVVITAEVTTTAVFYSLANNCLNMTFIMKAG